MVFIYSRATGRTLDSHKEFLRKLIIKGAKTVDSPEESSVAILFCPITSRFETDISAALSDTADLQRHKVIVVAMHHTFDPDYTLPNSRVAMAPIALLVDCLFYEGEGLLRCDRNKKAYQAVRKELGLKNKSLKFPKKRKK